MILSWEVVKPSMADTAQVGPQIAEKLGIPQVTYAEQILNIENGKATVKRRLERG